MARPIRTRRTKGSASACRTGDEGCCSSVAIVAADIMKMPRPAASITYSRQWERRRPAIGLTPHSVLGVDQIRARRGAAQDAVGNEHVEQPFDARWIALPEPR